MNPLLHDAVLKNDLSLVKKLIDEGADISCKDEQFLTPLRIAASLNAKEMVQLFLSSGVSVNYNQNDARIKDSSLFSNNILRYPEKKKNFFLTFDAGDDNTNMKYILDLLKKYHITATFFITGTFIKKYPDDVKRILAEGHIAGNHTYTHSFDYKSDEQLRKELSETEAAFKKNTGKDLSKIWRAPYLRHLFKPWMLKSARKLGYRHIDVTLCSKDWIPEGQSLYLSNKKFLNIFKNNIDFTSIRRIDIDGINYLQFRRINTDFDGIIMLMHAGSYRKKGADFVFTLEDVILQLISWGYLFDNCLKFEG